MEGRQRATETRIRPVPFFVRLFFLVGIRLIRTEPGKDGGWGGVMLPAAPVGSWQWTGQDRAGALSESREAATGEQREAAFPPSHLSHPSVLPPPAEKG